MALKIILWFVIGFFLGRLTGHVSHLKGLEELSDLVDEMGEAVNEQNKILEDLFRKIKDIEGGRK